MAAQRIVLTSPWRLGLFVFLLVVGTGFGLIYAYIELFDWKIDLNDAETVRYAYYVLGGVALVGLLGYVAVVTSARPLDRVVRGSKAREQMIKRLGKINDPRDVDLDDFDDEPTIMKVIERWARDAEVASSAQMQVASQREAMASLVQSIQKGGQAALDPEHESPDLLALVGAINEHVQEAAVAAEQRGVQGVPAPVPSEPVAAPSATSAPEFASAVRALGQAEAELRDFVASVAEQAAQMAQSAQQLASNDASGVVSTELVQVADAAHENAERLSDLRETLDTLAEESNKLAITMALQLSRLGEAGGEMLDTAEDVRGLSTRYQRLAGDLRVCETDQVSTLSRLKKLAGPGGNVDANAAQALVQEAMVLDQNAEALREVLGQLGDPLAKLRDLAGVSAAVDPVVPEPVAVAVDHDAASDERIYEIAELGGRELDDDTPQPPVRDLQEFGAIEL